MKKKKKKIVKGRHAFFFHLLKPIVFLIDKFFGFKRGRKYKIKKGEQIFVLSNHQAGLDPLFVSLSFNKLLHFVCTDSITTTGWIYKLLNHVFAPLPMKKGTTDLGCIQDMMQVAKEGGNLMMFPEGNRTYAEFQYEIGLGLVKLVKKINITLVLYNLVGGTGVDPRFAHKKRKGHLEGKVVKVIKPDELQQISNEDLLEIIRDYLKVYDSESKYEYKSKRSAEYLERMFFVCPKCQTQNKLVSKGQYIECLECGSKVKYTEHLRLEGDNDFPYTRMVEWYKFQKEFVKNYQVKEGEVIYKDEFCKLYTSESLQKRKLISKGSIALTDKELIFNDTIHLPIKELSIASPINGKNFNFTIGNNSYLLKGSDRFNPLKYVFMFNHLDTSMKEKSMDRYFNLD